MLTDEQKAFRRGGLGGSDANILMSGNDERILKLWEEKRGVREPEDLSDVLMVQMGVWTEEFNRQWFQKQTGRTVTNMGEQWMSFDETFMLCTLDGLTDGGNTVWEAKHVNGFTKANEVIGKYMPQLHHNMIVTATSTACLSVFFGNHAWDCYEVKFDYDYAETLIEVERKFWDCVQNDIKPILTVEKWLGPVDKKEDFTGNNQWASFARDWLDNKTAANKFDKAKDGIKEMIPADVVEASGHGIIVKRSSSGSLTIKEMK